MNFIQLCNLMVTDNFKHNVMFVDNVTSFVVRCLIVQCSILQC
jgi:hypothetical protein